MPELIERDDVTADEMCRACGHPGRWHRLDDTTNVSPVDPAAKFRCIGYDCEHVGRPGRCDIDCPDFLPPLIAPCRRCGHTMKPGDETTRLGCPYCNPRGYHLNTGVEP